MRLAEALRFPGKILGATISRTATRWFIAIQVDVPIEVAKLPRTGHGIEGVDLGLKAAVTLSTGETIHSPKLLRRALRRMRIRGRRLSRKLMAAKQRSGFGKRQPMPKGTRLPVSANGKKLAARLAATHARVANIRHDFTHKMTTRLVRENQALGLEDLHVSGMLANRHLARAISDVGWYEIRRQTTYKGVRYNTALTFASQWYPSSKTCSVCDARCPELTLAMRFWQCAVCKTVHDRDRNAATNLRRLATATALPVAKQAAKSAARPVYGPGTRRESYACQT